jgi:hypothetical protein
MGTGTGVGEDRLLPSRKDILDRLTLNERERRVLRSLERLVDRAEGYGLPEGFGRIGGLSDETMLRFGGREDRGA